VNGTTAPSKSQTAYSWIKQRIGDHRFTPGHRLVLGTIAAELEMSVVPVREAVRQLEAEGLLTYEHNVGARVALVDEDEYVHTMQTLGVVEGIATALAAPFLSEADLARAAEINDRMRAILTDFDDQLFTRLNGQFHAVLYTPCPNPHLLDLVQRGWTRLAGIRESTFGFVPERAAGSVAEHDHIIELISTGADAQQIEAAVREHRWNTLDAVLLARHSTTAEGRS
jgi:DNA-binding GntR family transcriptional regulator